METSHITEHDDEGKALCCFSWHVQRGTEY